MSIFRGNNSLFFVAIFVGASFSIFAQESRVENKVSLLLEATRQKYQLPAMAGAIVTGQGLQKSGVTGVRKAGSKTLATLEDQWHLGSDTKAMTSTLIGVFVDQGKLSWELTLKEVFPKEMDTFPEYWHRVQMLHLLSHHAGVPANLYWGSFSRNKTIQEQRLEVLQRIATLPTHTAPGTKYEYSNLGYVLAGAMLEQKINKSWEELIAEYLFQPLEMKHFGFGGMGTPGQEDQPWGHTENGKPTTTNGPDVDNPPVIGPAGRVHCTLDDWAKFIADQIRGARGEKALLRPSTYQKLQTPLFGSEYALGWIVTERSWGGGTVLTHSGSNTLHYAVVWIAPKRNFAVLVCTNQGGNKAAKACDEAVWALIQFHQKKE